jgi:hypothetical protein
MTLESRFDPTDEVPVLVISELGRSQKDKLKAKYVEWKKNCV